jgi:hypothetical protein
VKQQTKYWTEPQNSKGFKTAQITEAQASIKALVGTPDDPGAIEMATQLKVAELRKRGLDEAELAFEAKKDIAAVFKPRILRYFNQMMEATAGRAERLGDIDDQEERRRAEDFLARQGKRMAETVKLTGEALDLLATPAIPELKIAVNVDARQQAPKRRSGEKEFAEYLEAEPVE